jgi:hypothetical protein
MKRKSQCQKKRNPMQVERKCHCKINNILVTPIAKYTVCKFNGNPYGSRKFQLQIKE